MVLRPTPNLDSRDKGNREVDPPSLPFYELMARVGFLIYSGAQGRGNMMDGGSTKMHWHRVVLTGVNQKSGNEQNINNNSTRVLFGLSQRIGKNRRPVSLRDSRIQM